jgi:hypothetical protein
MADMIAQAKRAKDLFDRAGISLPVTLKRLLGTEDEAKPQHGVIIPPPEVGSRPVGWAQDWIAVELADASPITVVPAVLQGKKAAVRAKDLVEKVTQLLPAVSGGSVANTLSKLKVAGIIDRDEAGAGWVLKQPKAAALVHDGKLWGPATVFQKTEVASHRREAILHVLGRFTSGLQILQLVEHLQRCDWLHAPLNKDLVKEDLKVLSVKRKIRRRGNTKKWELMPETEE